MTVCIAASCAGRGALVAASDRMLSAHFLALEFDHPDAKIDQLSRTCVGLSAGDALPTSELFGACQVIVTQLMNPQIDQIADQIKEKYGELRRKSIEEQLFKPRGISFAQFYQGGLIRDLPAEIAMGLDDRVQRMNYGVELIVAGVDSTGAHIFGIADPGMMACYDRLGYHAIGSGMSHALLSLVATSQHWTTSLNQTVFNVYRAKKQAELAQGVGTATELRIIAPGGIRAVTQNELDEMEKVRQKVLSPQIREVDEAIAALPFEEGKDAKKAAE